MVDFLIQVPGQTVDFAEMIGVGMIGTGAFLAGALIVLIIWYLINAVLLSTLGKKLNTGPSWLPWIPILQLFMYPKLAKVHWAWGFLFIVPLVNLAAKIYFDWHIFERRKYPGWASLVQLAAFIPILGGLVALGYLVFYFIVAFKDK